LRRTLASKTQIGLIKATKSLQKQQVLEELVEEEGVPNATLKFLDVSSHQRVVEELEQEYEQDPSLTFFDVHENQEQLIN